MIFITNAAQKHFEKLLSKQEDGTQIRLFVTNPGTLTAECGVCYYPPYAVENKDIEIKFEKISIYIDKLHEPYLKDVEIDFLTDQFGSQLTLKAPNAKKSIAVKKNAPLIDQIEYFLQTTINPQLAHHGGKVSLIEINNENYVILKFSGGCNGCSMVNITLKEGIEKEMLSSFPQLKGVHDFTDHITGKHSFY